MPTATDWSGWACRWVNRTDTNLTAYRRGLETLAWFASDYFLPDAVVLEWRKRTHFNRCNS